MYVALQRFGLSDEGVEDALYDSQAIRRFVGVDLSHESAPDAMTRLNFRHLLERHQLTESIFNANNVHLAGKGLLQRDGTIVENPISPEKSSGGVKRTRASMCSPLIGAAGKDDCFFDVRLKVQEGEAGVQEIFQQNGWNVRHCRPIPIRA
jgi:IS5 family transposase